MVNSRKLKILLTASVIGLGSVSYIPYSFAESVTAIQTAQKSNLLSELEISGLKLDQAFSSDVKVYSATVENKVQEINLLLKSNTSSAQITVNGKNVGNGTSETYSLKTGENLFLITVNNGTNESSTYKLTITREQNGDNSLKHIELSDGVLSPRFSPSTTTYNIEGLNNEERIKIIPTAMKKTSTIKINNKSVTKNGMTVNVPVGESTIRITVTAENGESKTYNFHVKRLKSNDKSPGKSPGKSTPGTTISTKPSIGPTTSTNRNTNIQQNNQKGGQAVTVQKTTAGTPQQLPSTTEQKTSKAMLSSLTVSTGTWDSTFVKDEFTYHIAVDKETKNVTISPVAVHSSSTIKIEGETKKTIQLDEGNKTVISVVVQYDDDDRKTYVLVFDR
ncbi:cadherin-like beta sandwich domain-containing protein [Heyndrickxia vini]|uniref:Cadherin-like beta sandwich domain-containing protein n=1 Tax=Heyndrickxia vini TaxID=1476025 RepID=A0ABX7E2A6_9BACI|nr:cadherin-like beta sandwich domain-containing protein [Heyndrickxia vini]QQZ09394.1 cadherin-like beta sandwich domain-containing protein [Heyndrickxia vini]